MNKIIEIIVSAKGETRLETKGFTGVECREASKFFENALGSHLDETLKAEFHQRQRLSQSNQQQS